MKTSKTTKALLAGAAIAGLMSGTAARLHAAQTQSGGTQLTAGVMADDTDKEKGKHDCKGKNACKGQGGCKTDSNSCKGENACKGKGGCNTNKPM